MARGVDPKTKRLFVIDGAKALRAAINKVFGSQHPVQRCRKIRNVCDRLPEKQKAQVKAAIRARDERYTVRSVYRQSSGTTRGTTGYINPMGEQGEGRCRAIGLQCV